METKTIIILLVILILGFTAYFVRQANSGEEEQEVRATIQSVLQRE